MCFFLLDWMEGLTPRRKKKKEKEKYVPAKFYLHYVIVL